MIRVELVRVGDFLIGRSMGDRWNMQAAGIASLPWDRNQKAVKAARRKLAAFGLTLAVVRNATLQLHPTDDEAEALGMVNVVNLARIAA
jgi:hypothetical protein